MYHVKIHSSEFRIMLCIKRWAVLNLRYWGIILREYIYILPLQQECKHKQTIKYTTITLHFKNYKIKNQPASYIYYFLHKVTKWVDEPFTYSCLFCILSLKLRLRLWDFGFRRRLLLLLEEEWNEGEAFSHILVKRTVVVVWRDSEEDSELRMSFRTLISFHVL